jgi:hypothetical protein
MCFASCVYRSGPAIPIPVPRAGARLLRRARLLHADGLLALRQDVGERVGRGPEVRVAILEDKIIAPDPAKCELATAPMRYVPVNGFIGDIEATS